MKHKLNIIRKPQKSFSTYRACPVCFFLPFVIFHFRLKHSQTSQNIAKFFRFQNELTFKPPVEKCPDFASDALPTLGCPIKRNLDRNHGCRFWTPAPQIDFWVSCPCRMNRYNFGPICVPAVLVV